MSDAGAGHLSSSQTPELGQSGLGSARAAIMAHTPPQSAAETGPLSGPSSFRRMLLIKAGKKTAQ